MKRLTLSDEDYADVLAALDYTAEDYTSRADFEDKLTDTDAPDEEREEQYQYEDAADRYGVLAERIKATVEEVQA